MDMRSVEQDVDAARDSANRVREIREQAMEAKDKSLCNIYEKEKWLRYKEARKLEKESEKLEQEAYREYEKTSKHYRDVMQATIVHEQHDGAKVARTAAKCAYEEANSEINIISQLAEEVRQNCKDAIEQHG